MTPDFSAPHLLAADFLALAAGLGAIALVFAFTLITGSPPTPTSNSVRRAMLRVLPRRLPQLAAAEASTIYELGAGWGGNALALADAYPENPVVAIERSPLPWLVSRLRLVLRPRRNLTFRLGDFMHRPLGDGVLVVCYLSGAQMPPLERKLAAELETGALVLTHTFAMPDWRATDTVHADDLYKSPVYLYEVGLYEPAPRESGAVAAASQAASDALN